MDFCAVSDVWSPKAEEEGYLNRMASPHELRCFYLLTRWQDPMDRCHWAVAIAILSAATAAGAWSHKTLAP